MPARGAASLLSPLLTAHTDRAIKSTGMPKKATPEGTPTFFPVPLDSPSPALNQVKTKPSSWATLRSLRPHTHALSYPTTPQDRSDSAGRSSHTWIPRAQTALSRKFRVTLDKPFHISAVAASER
jgi:hypothetical protein